MDNSKRLNIHVIGVPEGEQKKKGGEKIIGRHNGRKFPKYSKTHKSTYKFKELSKYQQNKLRKYTPRHIIKCLKTKEK